MDKILETLKAIKRLLNEVTFYDIDTDKIWLSHVFCASGYIQDAITQYEKNPEKRYNKR